MSDLTLVLSGLSCGGCVASVKNVLAAVPGVSAVDVTLDPQQARVTYDPAQTGAAALAQVVIDAGFGAQPA